jgi:hypothetical protein
VNACEVTVAKIDWQYTDGTVSNVITTEYAQNRYTEPAVDYLITFAYEVDGHFYGGEFHTSEKYVEGKTITVGYDPTNPEKNDLVKSETSNFLWVTFMWITRISIPAVLIYFLIRGCK